MLASVSASRSQCNPMSLTVTKKKVLIRHFTEKKASVAFKRTDLSHFNQLTDADSLLVTRKLKKRRQELLVLRFVDMDGLDRFRMLFNAPPLARGPTGREATPVEAPVCYQRPPSEAGYQRAASRTTRTHSPVSLVEQPVYKTEHVQQHTQQSRARTVTPTRHRRSRSQQPTVRHHEKRSHHDKEVYLIKRISRSKDRKGETEYSRVTVYDLNSTPSNFSDTSSVSSSSSSSSSSSTTSISRCQRH